MLRKAVFMASAVSAAVVWGATVHPIDDGRALVNPGMGWTMLKRKNLGVAPAYRDYFPCLTVKDAKGGILAVLADDRFNLRKLPVAAPDKAEAVAGQATFRIGRWVAPRTEPGTYDVFVSVGEADGTPVVELPLKDGDGHRRYRLGRITFTRADK